MQARPNRQGFLDAPLNELLGAPANVRLLRVLSDSEAVSAPDAADKAGLTEAGARRALKRMARTGFVERIGSGRSQQFRMVEDSPLADGLKELFRAERTRYEELVARLRAVLTRFPEILSSWVEEHPSESGLPLHIGVLAAAADVPYLQSEVRRRILDLETWLDVAIELHFYSKAELPDVDWRSALMLAGWPAEQVDSGVIARAHADREDRARRISGVIAELVIREPGLIRRALRHTDHLLSTDSGAANHQIREWQQILQHYSRERIADFLRSDTPRAKRLRQSSPFFAVLSAEERDHIWTALDQNDA